ncbi:MAG: FkbM family methyltransferase [Thioploca sp.]|nr:FkbM family methyltransferase [Thioploca sp.]
MSLIKYFLKAIGTVIRDHHMNSLVTVGAKFCDKYLSYYWNQKHYNMNKNGELFLLQTLVTYWHRSFSYPITVFDVGANIGTYTQLVRTNFQNSMIHCFEIVPDTYATLVANLSGSNNIVINGYGLSNRETFLSISCHGKNDTQAREASLLSEHQHKTIICPVKTGDEYVTSQNIGFIDLLKIDTEGHEMAILEGFSQTFFRNQIRVIQFEYGTTWIAPKRFLHEAYAILEPAGFQIGRLYPNGVFFKSYNRLEDDHFRMGNYVAIHQTEQSLIKALNLNNRGKKIK